MIMHLITLDAIEHDNALFNSRITYYEIFAVVREFLEILL